MWIFSSFLCTAIALQGLWNVLDLKGGKATICWTNSEPFVMEYLDNVNAKK
jgi:hypothetical protein